MRGGERPRRRLLQLRHRVLPVLLLAACAYIVLSEHRPRLRRQRGDAMAGGDNRLPGWDSGGGRREALDTTQLQRQGSSGSGSGSLHTDGSNAGGGTGGGGSGDISGSRARGRASVGRASVGSPQHVIAGTADGSASAGVPALQQGTDLQQEQEAPRQGELLAVLVPYRDRTEQLSVFLQHMRAHLSAQGIPFVIVVAEQLGLGPFNRGALLNVAFLEAEKQEAAYVAVHDVDALPLDGVDYRFPRNGAGVLHLGSEPQQFGWAAPHARYCSGALLVATPMFRAVNGYSNGYWGWGGEDDDFCLRLSRQIEAQADGGGAAVPTSNAIPRAPHGRGRFASIDGDGAMPERKEFQKLNLARLTMWRLAGGSGRCMEGLSDVEAAGWGAYAGVERPAADLLHIFQELPPEVAPGLVPLPARASPAPPAHSNAAEFAAARATLQKVLLGQTAKLEALEHAQWAPAKATVLYNDAGLHEPKAVGLDSGALALADVIQVDDSADEPAESAASAAAEGAQPGGMAVERHPDGSALQHSSGMVGGGSGDSNSGSGSTGSRSSASGSEHRVQHEAKALGLGNSVAAEAAPAGAATVVAADSDGGSDGGSRSPTSGEPGQQGAGGGGGSKSSSALHQADTELQQSRGGSSGSGSSAAGDGTHSDTMPSASAQDASGGVSSGSGASIGGSGAGSGADSAAAEVEDDDDLESGGVLGYGDSLQAAAAMTRGSVVQLFVEDPDWAVERQQGSISGGKASNGAGTTTAADSRGKGVHNGLVSQSGGGSLSFGRWVAADDVEGLSGGGDGSGGQQEAAGELPGSAAAAGVQQMGAAAQRFWDKRRKRQQSAERDANGGISGYTQNLIAD